MTAWLGVVSRAHVQRGVSGGFAQVCHGKAALRWMQPDDWLISYSPTAEMVGEALHNFTALGEVLDDEVFQHDMGYGFVPFRRRIPYAKAREISLAALKEQLDLCAQPNWSMVLRRGHLKLSARDFETIASAMGFTLSVASW